MHEEGRARSSVRQEGGHVLQSAAPSVTRAVKMVQGCMPDPSAGSGSSSCGKGCPRGRHGQLAAAAATMVLGLDFGTSANRSSCSYGDRPVCMSRGLGKGRRVDVRVDGGRRLVLPPGRSIERWRSRRREQMLRRNKANDRVGASYGPAGEGLNGRT